jgi:hypothetical protein
MTDPIDPAQDSKPVGSPPIPPQNPSIEVTVKADLEGEFIKKYFDEQAKNTSLQRRNFEVQVWLAIATTLAFGAAAIYAYIAHRQSVISNGQLTTLQDTLGEFQKQTRLMKQQLVGTQGATLNLTLGFAGNGQLNVGLENMGVVTATHVHFKLDITPQTIADLRTTGTPISFEPTDIAPIKGKDAWVHTFLLPWHPHQLTIKKEWPADWPGKDTFELRGKFSYQNGFGDEVSEEFCKKWFPEFTITTKAQSSGGGGLYPCDEFRAVIRSVLEQERMAEKERQ